jgi:hypoxanthine phosphoribosyltransferase
VAPEIGEVLITADQIAARVRQLGADLAARYAGREPVLAAIMKGCVVFLADLVRAWPGPLDLEFVSAESYDGARPGDLRLALPPDFRRCIEGRPVLVLDDIYDTGRTLSAACRAIRDLGPTEVRTVVLLRKRIAPAGVPLAACSQCQPRQTLDASPLCPPDWVGFEIPDRFVVGYGLDFAERYRNLPCIGVLKPQLQNPPEWR